MMNNIYKKYKSNIIAVLVSLVFYGILFLFLIIAPGSDSSSLSDNKLASQDAEIQLQFLEAMPLPPQSAETEKADNKKAPTEPTKTSQSNNNIKNQNQSESKGVFQDNSNEETNSIETRDSVILAQLKKSLEVFKEIVPIDSLEKNPIQQKNEQTVRQALADRTHYSAEDREFFKSNYRAIQSFKRVYPYALKTKEIVDKLNSQLAKVTDNKEKRRLIKSTEKELFQQFEKDVRGMSYSQGKLLMKLLSRETNQTAYGLIKTYKGALPATFWYGVGLLFHENLKVKYDSIGEDATLEKIVKRYKLGNL